MFGKRHHESGNFLVTGDGESTVEVPFHVVNSRYKIESDPHQPESCNPCDRDSVEMSLHRECFHTVLKFKWHVFAPKKIFWSVKS